MSTSDTPPADGGNESATDARSLTQKLRDGLGTTPKSNLTEGVDAIFKQLSAGFGSGARPEVVGFFAPQLNMTRLAFKQVAGTVEGPLDKTLEDGVAKNGELWKGLDHLEATVKETGLDQALQKAGEELRLDQYGAQAKAQAAVALSFGQKCVIPALNTSEEARGAATDIMAKVIFSASQSAQKAGLTQEAILALVKGASEKAQVAIRANEAPDTSRSGRVLIGESIKAKATGFFR